MESGKPQACRRGNCRVLDFRSYASSKTELACPRFSCFDNSIFDKELEENSFNHYVVSK